jgi:trk system potassium uptake protein TrkA
MVLPDGVATAWRDPSGTVAVLELPLHEDWVGRRISEVEQTTGARVAFIVRFGTAVLPKADTVVQADDMVYAAAISGTVTDVCTAAAAAPEGS